MDRSKKEEKGVLRRMVDGVKEYYGPMPLLSGFITAGAVSTAAFVISSLYNGGGGIAELLANNNSDLVSSLYDIPDVICEAYKESRIFTSNWTMPSFAVGQFLGYKLKRTIQSFFKKK
jgi:hypothetical protein